MTCYRAVRVVSHVRLACSRLLVSVFRVVLVCFCVRQFAVV